jgi:hypothetical protein
MISAAHTVLEQHDEKVDYEAIAELADELLEFDDPVVRDETTPAKNSVTDDSLDLDL